MNDNKLFTEQRRKALLQLIRQNGSVNVNDIARRFQVSGTTARLDLTALEATGEIVRTHGGAVLKSLTVREPLINERIHGDEKARIADRAVEFIQNKDTILIDTGTTALALAKALVRSPFTDLTVYSNDLDVLRTLEEKEHWDLHMLGGRIRNGFHYAYSREILEELERYHFKKLFLCTSAISLTAGLTIVNSELARLKSAMVAASEEIYLLADSSKLHRVEFQKFADLSDVDVLITDTGVSKPDATKLAKAVTSLYVV